MEYFEILSLKAGDACGVNERSRGTWAFFVASHLSNTDALVHRFHSQKKKRSSPPPSINPGYGGNDSQGGDGNGAASSMSGNRFDPI